MCILQIKPNKFVFFLELIQDRLQAEVKRMQRRRQIIYNSNRRDLLQSPSPPLSDSGSDSEMMSAGSPQPSTSLRSSMISSLSIDKKDLKDQPLFTLKQVHIYKSPE